jgi:demethylmenaquinone methyltransferase/2-methoxy-6-polyprenyl-1,4-benzoquinol methylase
MKKYNKTSWFYDILDYPWEKQYRQWRPGLVGDMRGEVIEAGVGTGRNLKYYHPSINLTALDLCPGMLRRAMKRRKQASCCVQLLQEDACQMNSIPSDSYDWFLATFLCCVLPDELQPAVIQQMERVLKPNGRFRLLEMVYSKDPGLRRRQDFFSPFVERVYGARFDRNTLMHVEKFEKIKITNKRFLKHDVYLLIEGTVEK